MNYKAACTYRHRQAHTHTHNTITFHNLTHLTVITHSLLTPFSSHKLTLGPMSYSNKILGNRHLRGAHMQFFLAVAPSAFSLLLSAALRRVCEVAIHLTRWKVQLVCLGSSPLRNKDEGNMFGAEKQGEGGGGWKGEGDVKSRRKGAKWKRTKRAMRKSRCRKTS